METGYEVKQIYESPKELHLFEYTALTVFYTWEHTKFSSFIILQYRKIC
jgi:hypothetical protein